MSTEELVCPSCGAGDMSRQVAAIIWEGRSGVAMHGAFGGLVGLAPAAGVSSHYGRFSTDLATALSPPPRPPSRVAWIGWIVVLLTVAACLAGLVAITDDRASEAAVSTEGAPQFSPWQGYAVVVMPIAVVVVLLIALLVRRLRRDHRWRQAMPDMGAVWNTARYCARCAVAYFPRSEIPPSLPDRIDPGGFRSLVWQAGIIRRERGIGSNPAAPQI